MQAKYDRRIHDLKNQDKEQLAKEIQKLEHCLQSEKDRYQTLIQKLQQLEQSKSNTIDIAVHIHMYSLKREATSY